MEINLTPKYEFRYCQITNHDFNFVILDENNQALHTPFMCKDYIQDMVYTEVTGKPAGIYGITWKQGMWDISPDTLKLALLGGKFNLQNTAEDLAVFINAFEDALNIPRSVIITTNNPKNIVVEFSKEWTRNGPLLSAFTTLLRLAGTYKAGLDPLEYLKDLDSMRKTLEDNGEIKGIPAHMYVDMFRLKITLKRFAALLQGKTPEHNWTDFNSIHYVHDTGVAGFSKFPEVEV